MKRTTALFLGLTLSLSSLGAFAAEKAEKPAATKAEKKPAKAKATKTKASKKAAAPATGDAAEGAK